MVWRAEDPEGNEAGKIRHELVPYVRGRCLDLGCGGEKVWPHFIGVDNGLDTKLFGSKIRADIMVDSCEDLSLFGSGEWDCVFSSHLLEHIEEYQAALLEWWRLVKPGGRLILYLPHRDHYPRRGQPGANPDHKHDFEPSDIVGAMKKAKGGWTLERAEVRSGGREYSFLLVFRKRTDGLRIESWNAPKPAKTAAVVRLGAFGDALWSSSVASHLKEEGYHVTVYTQEAGESVLRNDPNIDRIIVVPQGLYDASGIVSYFLYETPKYDRFENLIGIVETRLLPAPNEVDFWRTEAQRRRLFGDRNYLEEIHRVAGVPNEPRQRFYPTQAETAWALAERAKLPGRVVVIAPAGSTAPKWWPYTQQLIDLLEDAGHFPIVLGDLRGQSFTAKRGKVVGLKWGIREALAFSLLADAVVGSESAIANAVAFEPMRKVVLLSHSSHANLTRDWVNTVGMEASAVPCYPCHRIHRTFEHCAVDAETGAAKCQAAIGARQVFEVLTEGFEQRIAA